MEDSPSAYATCQSHLHGKSLLDQGINGAAPADDLTKMSGRRGRTIERRSQRQPDHRSTRNEFHDDSRYSSIIATTDPTRVRAREKMDRAWSRININGAGLERIIANRRRVVPHH